MGVIKSASLYSVAGILSQLSSFIILPLYTSALTVQEFAEVSMIEMYIFIFMAISSLSVERAAQRFYYEQKVSDNAFDFAFSIVFIWGSLVSLLLWCLCLYLNVEFYQLGLFGVALVFSICIGQNITALAQVYFQVKQKPLFYLGLIVLKVLLLLGTGYWFVVVQKTGVLGYLYSYVVTFLVLACVSIMAMKSYNLFAAISTISARDISINFIRFSLPFVPTVFGQWVLGMSGRIVLDHFSSQTDVAIYALGYKLSTAIFFVNTALSMAIAPVLYEDLNRNGVPSLKVLELVKASNYLLAFCGCGLILFSGDLFNPVFGKLYEDSITMLGFMVFAHYISGFMGLTSNNYLSYYKRTVAHMLCFLTSAVVHIVSSITLVPVFGVYGVVCASIVSMLVLLVLHSYVLFRYSLPSLNYIDLIFGVCGLAVALVSSYMFSGVVWDGFYLEFLVRVFVLVFLFIFVLFIFRKNIKGIFPYEKMG